MRARFLLLTILLMQADVRAQYLFSTLSTADGLSSKEIFCAYRDSSGFMWFGTPNGLNRYDGSQTRIITPYTKAIPGLPNENIQNITEHGRGKLWVGTRAGLCYLDLRRSRFVSVLFIRGEDTITGPAIRKLIKDKQQRLWAGTAEGLFVEQGGVMRAASALYPAAASLDTFSCTAYDAGPDAQAFYLRSNNELRYFDYNTGTVFSKTYNPRHWSILDSGNYVALAAGPDGRIWFSRDGAGLGWFDPRSNASYIFPGWKDRLIYKMFFDAVGRMWFCETDYRAFVMSPEGTFTEILSKPEDPYRIAYTRFHNMYEDRDRNLWFSTPDGASKLPARPVLQAMITLPRDAGSRSVNGSLINTMVGADSTHFWICRMEHLLLMDTRTATFRKFKVSAGHDERTNSFYDVQRVGDEWWCATGDGIVRLNEATGRFTRLQAQPESVVKDGKTVIWIRADSGGRAWAAVWNDAIYRYDPGAGTWLKITGAGEPKKITSYFGFMDKRGRLYVGFGADGIRWYDERSKEWINPVSSEKDKALLKGLACYAVAEDAQGAKWIGTARKGVLRLDAAGRITDSISLRDGLHSNGVGALWLQPGGRLWISTSEGLQHTPVNRKMLSGFALTERTSVVNFSFPLLQAGQRLFVGLHGQLAVFDLEALAAGQAASPRPLLTNLQVLGKDVPLPFGDPELQLTYEQNFFSVAFSSPLHKEMPAMAYAYRLEGFDKDWVSAGRNQLASYTAVPPGHYRFLVRTTNADGEWSRNIAVLRVHIAPPFWMRWWAIGLALLMLAALGYAVYRNTLRRRRRKRMETAVDYFANSVYGHNSVNEICWDIARNCMAQMALEDCVVYLRDEHRPVLLQKAAYGPKSSGGFAVNDPIEIEIGKGIVGTVAASGKAILVSNTRKDPRYLVDDRSRMSELAVPIIHDGGVIGVIDSEHSRKGFYKDAHLKAFTTIAAITANKIAEAQAEAEVQEKALQLLEIQKLLAESQLMALRTQMNPHFVFNCLNSIQECIVTAKYGEASLYLNKFSKLFRMLLNNSGRGMISLAEEIEVLQLYLSLEHMRFERSFDYDVRVDEELEIAEVLIPSMLLQPFVENALWHGLMHKDGERRLLITFQSIGDELFRCIIDDNGIGREAAQKLKAAKSGGAAHKSKGMQITADRIELMRRQGQAASITILDKHDAAGLAGGTSIIIELSAYLTSTT